MIGARVGSAGSETATRNGVLLFNQGPPRGTRLASGGALSPDGLHVAFAAEDTQSGRTRLWVRALESPQPRAIDGTDAAERPFWSPDSQFIGFFANGRLKTVRAAGGPPTELTRVGPRPSGGAWGSRGQILFSTWPSGLSSISAAGGPVTAVTALRSDEVTHAWPQFLPDGDHFLYSVYAGPARQGTYLGSLTGGEPTRLIEADGGTAYSPAGFLVFTRNGILTAQGFDVDTLAVRGEPFSVVSGRVEMPTMTNGTLLSASAGGLIAFGGATGESELAWFDRTGRRLGALNASVPLHNPALSPDQRQVFGNTYPPTQTGLWLVDTERGSTSRLGSDASLAVLSPDGRQVAFNASVGETGVGIFVRPTSDLGAEGGEPRVVSPDRKLPTDWSRDGAIIYQVLTAQSGYDLWMLPTAGTGEPIPLLQSPANEIQGHLSPDGRWLAYASDESGRWEVYLQAFPGGGAKRSVSTTGGAEPQWRTDGRELFYLAEDRSLMVVSITPGQALQVGTPTPLFRTVTLGEATTYRNHYVVTDDGQRFLIDVLHDAALDPITVLLDWTSPRD